MAECRKVLPSSHWVSALPQLVSRVCHVSSDVRAWLKAVLVDLLLAHPHQALWSLAGLSRSAVAARKAAAAEVFTEALAASPKGGYHSNLYTKVRTVTSVTSGSTKFLCGL